MRKYILILLMGLMAFTATAQTRVSAAEQTRMVSQIESAAAAMKSMQCDFQQTKTLALLTSKMQSKGRMYYSGGKLLRWEYTSPYSYIFIINSGKVLMKNGAKSSTLDTKSSKLFQEITRIMMNSVTGRCLSSKTDFSVVMLKKGNDWIAQLTPLKKELKAIFSSLTLHFDATQKVVTEVEMKEKSGDTTVIRLQNIKKNTTIASSLFQL